MEISVGASVETTVESHQRGLHLRLLGPIALRRGDTALALPPSRKVRALLAYLALASRPHTRRHLCELLWEVPDDPRGELRWCLSRLRSALGPDDAKRIETRDDAVRLEIDGVVVDALAVDDAIRPGVATVSIDRLRALADGFAGDFLEGLELEGCPTFDAWVTAQRRRLSDCRVALLDQLVRNVADDEADRWIEQWLRLAPFDRRAHAALFGQLARRGRIREGDEHVATAMAQFEAEGLDGAGLREAWRAARIAPTPAQPIILSGGADPVQDPPRDPQRRASVAVMPFAHDDATSDLRGGVADALAHDVITRLAKLRNLLVIAQGSVFALHDRHLGAGVAGRMLDVDYVVTGGVRSRNDRLTVTVQLAEARTARVVWAETFHHKADDAFLVLEEIGNRIVASVAGEIETLERNRAILRPPSSLDAWEAHHRGLWHMYRFTVEDNARARHFFETAVRLDATFSRAWAGLSFTHFQNAFQGWTGRDAEIERGYAAASQSLLADDRDPAAHWAMGRAMWLRGRNDDAEAELRQSVDLSPNFALAHYSLAFVQSQSGDADAAISSSDWSRTLSPFDPLMFGMLGVRAMALMRLGRPEESADWAARAAARPNAHPHIYGIAAFSLALVGRLDEARAHAAAIRRAVPQYSVSDFLEAFRFDEHGAALFREGAKRVGMA